ncbi:MAG: hypothetical protein ACLU3I_06770 [Acutalibacteraceae bacterium]
MKYCPIAAPILQMAPLLSAWSAGRVCRLRKMVRKSLKKPVKSQSVWKRSVSTRSPKPRKKHEKPVGEHMGGAFIQRTYGYDGYYDDVLPSDAGKLKEGPDMELVKKVSAVAGVMLLIVILCVVAMYLL